MLSKKSERINDFVYTLLPLFIVTLTFVTLIYLQNDFSTAFFIFFIAVVMLFVAGLKIFHFVFISAVGIPAAFILLFTKEHRVKRLIAFLNPQIDPIGAGYQVNMARSALIGGGLWGTGVGEGTIKLGALPEAHSDFVFAVLGEEMGFLGVMFVLGILITFAVRGYTIAAKSSDQFNSILAFGITTTIFYQALLNIGVVSGLVPATGIPLPFFSLGGSSIVVTLFMYGVLLNLSRHINEGGVSE
ncbi:MAG: hypothetical protein DRP87_06300 [Spirochaetes bacterium]|nr:MAG: hypothetical protein DRP87_06300 [Spirochaetota bacterium]